MADVAPPYPFVRCAGLYTAMANWIGGDRLPDQVKKMEEGLQLNLLVGAIKIRENGVGGDWEQLIKLASRDARNVAELYRDRFGLNYVASGEAFGDDHLIWSDLDTCNLISDRIRSSSILDQIK